MVPVGSGVRREYADMQRSFTCCVGTGMESHALHGLGLYYEDGNRLWVNIYAPSTAQWEAAGVKLAMQTTFPEGDSAALTFDLRTPREFTLALRRPSWAGAGFNVLVNGQPVANPGAPGSYVDITRRWRSGDLVTLTLPKMVRLEHLPDAPTKAVIMWGPLVLAGDHGAAPRRRDDGDGDGVSAAAPEPVALVTSQPLSQWLTPITSKPGNYRASGVVRTVAANAPIDVELAPFYSMHRRSYTAYWDHLTAAELASRAEALAAERERMRALEAVTIAHADPGDRGSEKKFNQQGVETSVIRSDGRAGRRAIQWFSYDLPVTGDGPFALVATYNGDQRRPRSFDVLVNGTRVGSETQPQSSVSRFYDKEYAVPAALIRDRSALAVRFEATNGLEVTPVFGVRLVKR
jgi:hypothetical protein